MILIFELLHIERNIDILENITDTKTAENNELTYKRYTHDKLKPLYNANTQILIVGSFPSSIEDENRDYYNDSNNCMKDILKKVCDIDTNESIQSSSFLEFGIGFCDIIQSCFAQPNFQDKDIVSPVINNDVIKIANEENIKVIVVTGKLAWKLFCSVAHSIKKNKIIYKIPSTSGLSIRYKKIDTDAIISTLKLFIKK